MAAATRPTPAPPGNSDDVIDDEIVAGECEGSDAPVKPVEELGTQMPHH